MANLGIRRGRLQWLARQDQDANPRQKALQLKPATVGGDIVLEVTGLSKYFGGLKASTASTSR